MVFGTPVRVPLDHIAGVSNVPAAETLADRVRDLVAFGRRSLTRAQAWQKAAHDKRRVHAEHAVGDRVLLSA